MIYICMTHLNEYVLLRLFLLMMQFLSFEDTNIHDEAILQSLLHISTLVVCLLGSLIDG